MLDHPAEVERDPQRIIEQIVAAMRRQVGDELRCGGAVVAVSGGVDSAVCAALATRAFGSPRVKALALPERDSDPRSLPLAWELAAALGLDLHIEDITPIVESAGCYARRDAAIARAAPFAAGWPSKIAIQRGVDGSQPPLGILVVRSPGGEERRVILPPREFREIVAATNIKQRVRAIATHYHADRLRYAVVGTPNRLEYRLGFFVKGGDGLADVLPIAHLYKREVYALAEALGVPAAIRTRTPTTDIYPLPQTQEEFFLGLPLSTLDALLEAQESGLTPTAAAARLGLRLPLVERAFGELARKESVAEFLHHPPMLVRPLAPELPQTVAGVA
jgi:NAD+ synthase